jgi:hypothetical protein
VTTDVLAIREFYEPDGVFVSALIDPRPRPELADVQNHADHRRVPIEEVGVSDLRYPITVLDRAADELSTGPHARPSAFSISRADHPRQGRRRDRGEHGSHYRVIDVRRSCLLTAFPDWG